MYRYNICQRLTTGELLYLGKQQQWVNDVSHAITLHGSGVPAQRAGEGTGAGDVLGVFLVPLRQTIAQTNAPFSVLPRQSQPARGPAVSVARQA